MGAQSEQTRRRPGVARGVWEMLLFPMGCVGLRQAAWVSSGVPSTEVTQTELTEESNTRSEEKQEGEKKKTLAGRGRNGIPLPN